jgi:methionyl-tRNA synthetase
MWQNFSGGWVMPLGTGWLLGLGGLVIFVLVLWSIVWKGLALWKAAREGSKVWFVVLLVVNTVGILEILYLYVFSKKSEPAAPTVVK